MKLNAPTIFVILGITGDLAQHKIIPAIYDLYTKDLLPDQFKVVGFSRRDLSPEDMEILVRNSLSKKKDENGTLDSFVKRTVYVQGDFDDLNAFTHLKDFLGQVDAEFGICTNKLLYLAVPPALYEGLFNKIHDSGLSDPCGGDLGWTRILVEKPFGTDEKQARELDMLLGKLFDERQVYRIDHYLAKEAVQNILTFRFANSMFEPLWNKDHIESVSVRFYEAKTAEGRGAFYDANGALKDVGQNHLLQLLAVATMEKPTNFNCSEIRLERAKVLGALVADEINCTARGQYHGYIEENGVNPESQTETFFTLRASVDNHRWSGVPFILSAGKALKENRIEIELMFKDGELPEYFPHSHKSEERNSLRFKIQPDEGIALSFWFKVPGLEPKLEKRKMAFVYAESELDSLMPDAYEKVLYDCVAGDQTLFPSTSEILSSWKFVTAAGDVLAKAPLTQYEVGSDPQSLLPNSCML